MRIFIISAIAVGLSASAGAAPKAAVAPPSEDLLRAAARAIVSPILAQSDSQQTSSQAKVSSSQQANDVSADASMNLSCGKKKPERKPTCPRPVSPD